MSEDPGQTCDDPENRDLVPAASRKRPAVGRRVAATWRRLTRKPAWLLGVAGLALLAASVVRVIMTSSGGGLVSVVVAGAVLLVSPFIIGRVERLSVGSSGLELQLARDVADLGAPKTAQILDRTDLAKFAESYAFVHNELEDPDYYDAKIHLQDLLVERAATLASNEKFDATEVRTLYATAAPTTRVLVLGLMQGDCSLADSQTILAAVEKPLSKNEQYQGLRLAKRCWYRLSGLERAAIKCAIRNQPDIQAGTSRHQLAQKILHLPDPPSGRSPLST